MTDIKVIKRDGSQELLQTSKIKDVIGWACANLDVNPLALESKIEGILEDGVSTTLIHDNIIFHAQTLASAEQPDWVYVAGRLNTMKLWKDTRAYEMEFATYLDEMKLRGTYSHPVLESYTEQDIYRLEKSIVQDRDLAHSYGSTITATKKYLSEGEVLQYMFMTEAMIIFGERYSGEERLEKVVNLYNELSLRKVSLATPWLSNLRANGNISSCFIISIDDDIDSITDGWKKAAKISKMGGGLGIYLGNLRAKGASIAGRPNSAKSVNSCATILNGIAQYIDQGGELRHAY